MIAAFQMYDWTEVRSRTDRFWAAVGGYLRDQGISDVRSSRVTLKQEFEYSQGASRFAAVRAINATPSNNACSRSFVRLVAPSGNNSVPLKIVQE